MAYYESITEAQTELAEVRATIKRVRGIGQSHANNSGGSSRATTEAELKQLRKDEHTISRAIRAMQGGGVSSQRSGW